MSMERIRYENLNTSKNFNKVFAKQFDLYDSYKNINYYNDVLGLLIFNGESYLDFGCGGGGPLNKIKQKYPLINIVGVDISDFVIERNAELFPKCNFYTVDEFFKNNFKVDNILSSHTFEHVENPLELANHLLSRANKSLTIIVPFEDSWRECDQHLWRFDKKSFESLKPSLIVVGLTNRGANTEIIFYWNKNRKIPRMLSLIFNFKKIIKQDPMGMLKIILRKLKLLR